MFTKPKVFPTIREMLVEELDELIDSIREVKAIALNVERYLDEFFCEVDDLNESSAPTKLPR